MFTDTLSASIKNCNSSGRCQAVAEEFNAQMYKACSSMKVELKINPRSAGLHASQKIQPSTYSKLLTMLLYGFAVGAPLIMAILTDVQTLVPIFGTSHQHGYRHLHTPHMLTSGAQYLFMMPTYVLIIGIYSFW